METRKRPVGIYRRYECVEMHRFSTIDGVVTRMDETKLPANRPPKSKSPEYHQPL